MMYTTSYSRKPALWMQIICMLILLSVIVAKILLMPAMQIVDSMVIFPDSWVNMPISLYKILVLCILLGNGVLLHFLLLSHTLIELRDYRAIIFYWFIHIMLPATIALPNMLAESIFLCFLLPSLLVGNIKEVRTNDFMYGFFCAILSLLYSPFILLLLLLYFVYLFNRDLSFKRIILPLMGVGLLMVYKLSYAYVMDIPIRYSAWVWRWQGAILHTHFMESVCIGISIVFMSILVLYLLSKATKVVVNRRKKWYVLMLNFVVVLILTILLKDKYHLYLSIWNVISVALLSVGVYHIKNKIFNYLVIILFILALYVNFV